MKLFIAALISLLAVACSTTGGGSPTTPQQVIFQAQSNYSAALQVAVAYKSLPRCTPGAPPLCSKPEVIAKLQQADDVAFNALQAAQNTARSPTAGANADTVILAAQQAVAALTAITATLSTK